MKRIFRILMTAAAVVLLASCKKNDHSFVVEGTLANGADKMLYLEEMVPDNMGQAVFVDSIACDKNGHFRYEGEMSYQTFFNLYVKSGDFVVLLPNFGETIELTGDYDKLSTTYMVNGSADSRLMWQIQNYINTTSVALTELVQQDEQNRATLKGEAYDKAHKVTDSIFIAEYELLHETLVHNRKQRVVGYTLCRRRSLQPERACVLCRQGLCCIRRGAQRTRGCLSRQPAHTILPSAYGPRP